MRPKWSCLALIPSAMFVNNHTSQLKHLIPKNSSRGVLNWGCFRATGPKHWAVIEASMNSSWRHFYEAMYLTTKTWLKWRTKIWSTPVNLHQNGREINESRFCNGRVEVQTSVQLKSCGGKRRESCARVNVQKPRWTEAMLPEWAKILPQPFERLITSCRKQPLQVIPDKVRSTSYWTTCAHTFFFFWLHFC